MDVFLASVINLIILNLIISTVLRSDVVLLSLVVSVIFTVATHIIMAVRQWREWIMPAPWHWNEAGYWHMLSMTLQMAYAFYVPVLLVRNPQLLDLGVTKLSLVIITALGLIFLWAIGKSKQSKPW